MPNRRGIIVGEEVNDGLHSDKEKEKSGGASVRKLLSAQQVSVCVCVCVYVINRNQLIGILAVAGGT